jgi:hypothetical protein
MSSDFIGDLTVVTIILVVLLTVLGAGVVGNWIGERMALLGKAYRPTFVLIACVIAVGLVVVWAW